jgi:hypothetical protein
VAEHLSSKHKTLSSNASKWVGAKAGGKGRFRMLLLSKTSTQRGLFQMSICKMQSNCVTVIIFGAPSLHQALVTIIKTKVRLLIQLQFL